MQERFDRLEDQADAQSASLRNQAAEIQKDLVATRHSQRQVLQQLTVQVVEIQKDVNLHAGEIGTLKAGINTHDDWRNRIIGGMALIVFLFPATVAVILKFG